MNVKEFDDILQKVSDLQVFLEYGEKTLHVLDDVVSFTKQIEPVIGGIRSLVDVTTQKLPRAAEQLETVNRTSEQASTDILNAIDRMSATLEALATGSSAAPDTSVIRRSAEKIDVLVRTVASQSSDEDAKELNNLWDLHRQSLRMLESSFVDGAAIESLRMECTSIMMASQMQDITGQQIATVIGTVQALDDLLRRLLAEVFDVLHATQPKEEGSHEPAAVTVGTDERKQLVESLLERARTGDLLARAGVSL